MTPMFGSGEVRKRVLERIRERLGLRLEAVGEDEEGRGNNEEVYIDIDCAAIVTCASLPSLLGRRP